ncbi:hypothetical protein NUU61_003926 [Penicillium alfredii]|uniref:Zn(2)-C6 fungal-type domain-containing protein n=1 Tax=Penicillium alfredii TaxID=1506179 RepID=A0A9W9FKC8_9EURO|nr:uncharacterized protein NUU61_003926 [Penicillium alfredii]KAJ5101704.1 hypothetical protein NUU61_003926 [Penicillium alfredii]
MVSVRSSGPQMVGLGFPYQSIPSEGPVRPPPVRRAANLAQVRSFDAAQIRYGAPLDLAYSQDPSSSRGMCIADTAHDNQRAVSQDVQHLSSSNLATTVDGTFITYHANGGQQVPRFQVPSGSVSYSTTPTSSHQAIPMAISSLHTSVSAPELRSRQSTWSLDSQDSWSYAPANYEDHHDPSNNGTRDSHFPFAAVPPQAEAPPPGRPFNFLIEDPKTSRYHREKIPRSQADRESQRENIRLLKGSGGACLWCYRSKKRCGLSNPCLSCTSTRRKCIRSSVQLSLSGLQVGGSPPDVSMVPLKPPSSEALDMLNSLNTLVFTKMTAMKAVLNIRRSDDGALEMCTMYVDRRDMVFSNVSCSLDQLVAKASKHLRCVELAKLEEAYTFHPLIQTALSMTKLFMVTRCLATTHVYIRSLDVDPGRLMMLYILVVCCRELFEMSEGFSVELCEALRRKDVQDSLSDGKYLHPTTNLNPVWVASALYYRIVSGLLELRESPLMTKIFGCRASHLSRLWCTLWSILKSVPANNKTSSKDATGSALKDQIPVLPDSKFFDLAFWLGPLDCNDELPPVAVSKQHGDPFAGESYDMNSFLRDDCVESSVLSNAPQPVQALLPVCPSPKPVAIPLRESVAVDETPCMGMQQDIFADVLEPTPGTWDAVASFDSIYNENCR